MMEWLLCPICHGTKRQPGFEFIWCAACKETGYRWTWLRRIFGKISDRRYAYRLSNHV